jgi:hypothetical protein
LPTACSAQFGKPETSLVFIEPISENETAAESDNKPPTIHANNHVAPLPSVVPLTELFLKKIPIPITVPTNIVSEATKPIFLAFFIDIKYFLSFLKIFVLF